MKTTPKKPTKKPGANRNEIAVKPQKHDANFRQSRDVREDRGERQIKLGGAKNSGRAK
ncbi:MAG: hypothetical protein K8R23_15115 [Chthoniobacter sp.]|nr:hypothetical protein [Chthoniobacter sp.]